MKRHAIFTASGYLIGHNWYGQRCLKHFDVKFSTDERKPFTQHARNVRDMLEHITRDGDFQDVRIDSNSLDITATWTFLTRSGRRMNIRYIRVNADKHADYLTDDSAVEWIDELEAGYDE